MRLRNWFACGLAVLMLAGGAVFGQAKAKKPRRPKPRRPQPILRGEMARVAKELKLTEAQQKQIAEAVKAQQAAAKAWEEDNTAKIKEIQDQSKKLREQMTALNKQRQQFRDAEKVKIAEVLTAEQKTGWVRYVLRSSVMRQFRGVKLTDDQAAKLAELVGQAAEKVSAMTDEQKAEGTAKATAELRKAVAGMITPEQKTQARIDALAGRVLGALRRAKLTDEQIAKVKALAAEAAGENARAAARVEALTKELNDLRKKVRSGGHEDVLKKAKETVLTDEQRGKLTPPPKKKNPAAPAKEKT